MKSNKRICLGMLVIVLVFGMTVIGCGAGGIEGTWDFTSTPAEMKIKFENGTCQWIHQKGTVNGTYTIEGNRLTMNVSYDVEVYSFSVKGNTLILTAADGTSYTGTKVK